MRLSGLGQLAAGFEVRSHVIERTHQVAHLSSGDVGDTLLGHAGELHPRAITALELPAGTSAMELSLDVLLAAAPALPTAVPVSPYPAGSVDVAMGHLALPVCGRPRWAIQASRVSSQVTLVPGPET